MRIPENLAVAPARQAVRGDVPVLARVLTDAFRTDPVYEWLFPSLARRAVDQPRFFAAVMNHYVRHGLVFTTPELQGASIWEPPRLQPAGILNELPVGLRLAPLLGSRLLIAIRGWLPVHALRPRQPHWYLAVLGTHPQHQGRGVGANLMRAVLERCDHDGLPAYLEASRHETVSYYRRQGFELVGPSELFRGPTIWRMLRMPPT